jgi:HxlR-like helix-turn-helix protein
VSRGILELVPAGDGGARQEYRLTEMGRDLFPVMVALRQWGERHLFEADEERSSLVERDTGLSVRLDIRAQDGRPIGPDDTVILKVLGQERPASKRKI